MRWLTERIQTQIAAPGIDLDGYDRGLGAYAADLERSPVQYPATPLAPAPLAS